MIITPYNYKTGTVLLNYQWVPLNKLKMHLDIFSYLSTVDYLQLQGTRFGVNGSKMDYSEKDFRVFTIFLRRITFSCHTCYFWRGVILYFALILLTVISVLPYFYFCLSPSYFQTSGLIRAGISVGKFWIQFLQTNFK